MLHGVSAVWCTSFSCEGSRLCGKLCVIPGSDPAVVCLGEGGAVVVLSELLATVGAGCVNRVWREWCHRAGVSAAAAETGAAPAAIAMLLHVHNVPADRCMPCWFVVAQVVGITPHTTPAFRGAGAWLCKAMFAAQCTAIRLGTSMTMLLLRRGPECCWIAQGLCLGLLRPAGICTGKICCTVCANSAACPVTATPSLVVPVFSCVVEHGTGQEQFCCGI